MLTNIASQSLNQNNGLPDTESVPGSKSFNVGLEYAFKGHLLRPFMKDGEVWFVASDVCAILEHSNARVAIGRLDDDQKGVSTVYTLGGPQDVGVINESGLYTLIFSSRKSQAKEFCRWVTREVLPSIRKTGRYSKNGSGPEALDESFSDPGRYVVMVAPDHRRHVQHYRLEALLDDVRENDTRLLALSLHSIECWWQKVEQMASIGMETKESSARVRLERAIKDGARIADGVLNAQRYEESVRAERGF